MNHNFSFTQLLRSEYSSLHFQNHILAAKAFDTTPFNMNFKVEHMHSHYNVTNNKHNYNRITEC